MHSVLFVVVGEGGVGRDMQKRETFSFGSSGFQMPVSLLTKWLMNLSGHKNQGHVCFSIRANRI